MSTNINVNRALFLFRVVDDCVQDVRATVREARRSLGFTCIALLSLAVAIGGVTAAFSVLDAFMLRRLPVGHPESLFAFSTANSSEWNAWSIAPFLRWQESPDAPFDVAAASDVSSLKTPSRGNDGRNVRVTLVSGNYFRVMGVAIPIGRNLPDTTTITPNGEPIAIISDAFWTQWFGRTPDVIGKTLELNDVSYEVIGIARPGFSGHVVGHPVDVWVPLAMAPALVRDLPGLLDDRWATGASWLRVFGRLRTGVEVEQARQSADLVYRRFAADQSAAIGATSAAAKRTARQSISLLQAAGGFAPERARFVWPLLVLSGFTGLVLLVACANFTNLMLARSETRQREFMIRHALGASRWRLIRQSITECTALAAVAGAPGLLFAQWATTALVHQVPITITPLELGVTVDARVAAFTIASVAIVIMFGLWPCARVVRSASHRSVSALQHSMVAPRRRALGGRLMLIGQLTLCAVLLIGAGLLLRTVRNLRHQDFGFDQHVLLVSVTTKQAGYSEAAAALLMRGVGDRVRTLPGVEAVGLSGPTLLDSGNYWIDSSQELLTDQGTVLPGTRWTFAAVGPGFFEAIGMSLLNGRGFEEADSLAAADSIVLNRSLSTFLFGDRNPIGRRVRLNQRAPMQTVVGVVNDVKQTSPRDRGLGIVYLPLRQLRRVVVAVRTAGPPEAMVPAIKAQLNAFSPDLSVDSARPIGDLLDESIAVERLTSALSLCLAAIVIIIGCLGLYALIAYDVARRTHELGIRLALGATRNTILAMVLRDAAYLVLPALAIGIPLGIVAIRPLSSLLYGVRVGDAGTLLCVAGLLVVVAVAATLQPARTASRIDPIALLRAE